MPAPQPWRRAHSAMSFRRQVMSGFKWAAASRLVAQLATWATTLFVIRLLSPADYGLMALAMLCIGFVTLVNEMGLGAALVQVRELDDGLIDRAFTVMFFVNIGFGACLFVFAPLVGQFFGDTQLTWVLRALCLQFVLAAWITVPAALIERSLDFRRRAIIDVLANVLGGVLTLLFAWIGWGVWALVWGGILQMAIRAVGLAMVAPYSPHFTMSLHGTGKLLRFGGAVSLNQVLYFIYSQADIFVAGKLLGRESLGAYSVAMEISSLPMTKVAGLFNSVALPAFSRIQDQRDRVGQNTLRVARMVGLVSFPVFFGLSAVAPELVLTLLGEKWASAILPTQIACLVVPLRMTGILLSPAVQSMGRADVSAGNLAVACAVMPLAFYVGASRAGLVGMSLAWLIGYPLVFAIILKRSCMVLSIRPGVFVQSMMPAACGATIMYAGVFAVRTLIIPPGSVSVPLALGVFILTGACVYTAFSLMVNRQTVVEFVGLFRA